MQIAIVNSEAGPPTPRAFALSMTIRSFKGRRDVEVHLFRHAWDPAEEAGHDWDRLIGPPLEAGGPADPATSRRVVLESFTAEERDRIVAFLMEQYATRLSAINSRPLDFPIPAGLPALSDMREGRAMGFVHFERIPSYTLGLPLRGFYDLDQHRPIVEGEG
jgi:hypothetical protein